MCSNFGGSDVSPPLMLREANPHWGVGWKSFALLHMAYVSGSVEALPTLIWPLFLKWQVPKKKSIYLAKNLLWQLLSILKWRSRQILNSKNTPRMSWILHKSSKQAPPIREIQSSRILYIIPSIPITWVSQFHSQDISTRRLQIFQSLATINLFLNSVKQEVVK